MSVAEGVAAGAVAVSGTVPVVITAPVATVVCACAAFQDYKLASKDRGSMEVQRLQDERPGSVSAKRWTETDLIDLLGRYGFECQSKEPAEWLKEKRPIHKLLHLVVNKLRASVKVDSLAGAFGPEKTVVFETKREKKAFMRILVMAVGNGLLARASFSEKKALSDMPFIKSNALLSVLSSVCSIAGAMVPGFLQQWADTSFGPVGPDHSSLLHPEQGGWESGTRAVAVVTGLVFPWCLNMMFRSRLSLRRDISDRYRKFFFNRTYEMESSSWWSPRISADHRRAYIETLCRLFPVVKTLQVSDEKATFIEGEVDTLLTTINKQSSGDFIKFTKVKAPFADDAPEQSQGTSLRDVAYDIASAENFYRVVGAVVGGALALVASNMFYSLYSSEAAPTQVAEVGYPVDITVPTAAFQDFPTGDFDVATHAQPAAPQVECHSQADAFSLGDGKPTLGHDCAIYRDGKQVVGAYFGPDATPPMPVRGPAEQCVSIDGSSYKVYKDPLNNVLRQTDFVRANTLSTWQEEDAGVAKIPNGAVLYEHFDVVERWQYLNRNTFTAIRPWFLEAFFGAFGINTNHPNAKEDTPDTDRVDLVKAHERHNSLSDADDTAPEGDTSRPKPTTSLRPLSTLLPVDEQLRVNVPTLLFDDYTFSSRRLSKNMYIAMLMVAKNKATAITPLFDGNGKLQNDVDAFELMEMIWEQYTQNVGTRWEYRSLPFISYAAPPQ